MEPYLSLQPRPHGSRSGAIEAFSYSTSSSAADLCHCHMLYCHMLTAAETALWAWPQQGAPHARGDEGVGGAEE
jgi:hypothetical protein